MNPKFGYIIITHGGLAAELLKVAQYIMGDKLPDFAALELPFMKDMEEEIHADSSTPFTDRRKWLSARILEARARVDKGDGVIVFTDLLGGTSFSVANETLKNRRAAVISGVNLPMLLKAANLASDTLEDAARELTMRSGKAIEWFTCGKKGQ
jgi:mannose/fructose-specific phosphotransferase system component IIA